MAEERKLSLAEIGRKLKERHREDHKYPTQIEDNSRRFKAFLGLVLCDEPKLANEYAWNKAKELSDLHLKPGEESRTSYNMGYNPPPS